MEYENLYRKFKENIPESIDFCKYKEKENLVDETVGIHIAFGLIFVPYVLMVIAEQKSLMIEKVFDFMEKMAACEDVKIREVLDFTILEQLADEGHDILNECKKNMGSVTLQHCEEIKRYLY